MHDLIDLALNCKKQTQAPFFLTMLKHNMLQIFKRTSETAVGTESVIHLETICNSFNKKNEKIVLLKSNPF